MLSLLLDLGIFQSPYTFAFAIGMTAGIVMFLYFFFKVIVKFAS